MAKVADQKTMDLKSDKYGRKAGACPTVVGGDFDGDRDMDFALFLVDKSTAAPMLVGAFATQKGWAIDKLPIWTDQISGAYIVLVKSGTFERAATAQVVPPKGNERESIDVGSTGILAVNAGIIAGRAKSTYAVYVYEDGQWLYVLDPK